MSDRQDTNGHPEFWLDKNSVRRHFDRAAETYDDHAILQAEVARRLIERFDFISLQPETMLDIGAGTGHLSLALAARFASANLVAMDLSERMCRQLQKKLDKDAVGSDCVLPLCGDAENLPFRDHSFDLVMSNLSLQWSNEPDKVFAEVRRVLKPGGLFMFTTFGPDTLHELRWCWSQIDEYNHVNAFFDMHDLGDALMRHGFAEPVMDVEQMTLTYTDTMSLMKDLKNIGASNATRGRSGKLTSRKTFQQLADLYERFRQDKVLPASYEVIHGHAWIGQPVDAQTVEVRFEK